MTLKDRYLISLGSTHDKDSFRVGTNCLATADPAACQGGAPKCTNNMCGKACNKPCKKTTGPPDMRLGGGILTYCKIAIPMCRAIRLANLVSLLQTETMC